MYYAGLDIAYSKRKKMWLVFIDARLNVLSYEVPTIRKGRDIFFETFQERLSAVSREGNVILFVEEPPNPRNATVYGR